MKHSCQDGGVCITACEVVKGRVHEENQTFFILPSFYLSTSSSFLGTYLLSEMLCLGGGGMW